MRPDTYAFVCEDLDRKVGRRSYSICIVVYGGYARQMSHIWLDSKANIAGLLIKVC